MAQPTKKDAPKFGETMGAYAPTGLLHGRRADAAKPTKRLPWTEIIIGALCLVIGFGGGLYLIKPRGANVATVVTPSSSVAPFGSPDSVLKASQPVPVASSGATTLQPGKTTGDIQGSQPDLQPQSATLMMQATVSANQLQGSYNGPTSVQ